MNEKMICLFRHIIGCETTKKKVPTLLCSGTLVVERTSDQCRDSRITRHLPHFTSIEKMCLELNFTRDVHHTLCSIVM